MQNILNPKDLAKKITDNILKDMSSMDIDNILYSLEKYYTNENKKQELKIKFLSEFEEQLKYLKNKDKDSIDGLKSVILKKILHK